MNCLKFSTKSCNNIDYSKQNRVKLIKELEQEVKNQNKKTKPYLSDYVADDENMEPEICKNQKVIINKLKTSYSETDIFLVMTPSGAKLRRVKILSEETISLISTNISSNNENFLIDDIGILGKVVFHEN